MSKLRLSRRDDPLAVSSPESDPTRTAQAEHEEAAKVESQLAAREADTIDAVPARSKRRGVTARRRAAGPRRTGPAPGPYDGDRLEQTGWRLYDGLLGRVRRLASELNDAGVPASAASVAAAVLHFHTPTDVDEADELMRRWRQVTASRSRAQRDAR
jgi:hypothetical protein